MDVVDGGKHAANKLGGAAHIALKFDIDRIKGLAVVMVAICEDVVFRANMVNEINFTKKDNVSKL